MRLIIPALFILLVETSAAQQTPRLSLSATRIAEGDSTVVTWSTSGDSAFIPGLGMVGPRGSRVLRPRATRTIYLISANGARVDSAVVTVTGGSRAGPTDSASFKFARTYVVRGKQIMQLLDGIERTLQTRLGYPAPNVALLPTRVWVVTTATRERPDLVQPDENTIQLRRVAYRIQINPQPDSSYRCEIAVVVEYKKRIERQFRLEPSETMYAREVERLANALAWVP